jgi:hypothetical protein
MNDSQMNTERDNHTHKLKFRDLCMLVEESRQILSILWFGGSSVRKKGYYLVSWKTIRVNTDQGGLGIINLKTMNKVLLWKWLWRLDNPQKKESWKEIIFSRYKNKRSTINVSPFWKEVRK